MNKCDVCKVNVHPQHEVCPLCGKRLGNPAQSATAYPLYKSRGNGNGFSVDKLLLFLLIAASAVLIFINVMTFNGRAPLWSVTAAASLALPWFIYRLFINAKRSLGEKILQTYAAVTFYLIVIDLLTGFNKWSTTFVLPFLTIAVTVFFTIIALSSSANFKKYLGYITALIFISLCPAVIFLFAFSTQAWTGFAAALFCLLTVIGLVIFKGEEFKREVKKQFHI